MSNKFKFYTPVEIKKSKTNSNTESMKIGGIASTIDEDSDGEYLDPTGFILDDFITTGFVNWHHQAKNKPKTIVGEPTVAEIRKDGFYVEVDLYPSSDIAREIYETALILQKDSTTRRLGFSIEGEVIERGSDDEDDPDYKKVLKANITGLAITHMPKNAKTFAEIIKGFTGDTKTSIVKSESEAVTDTEDEDSSGITTKNSKAIIKESVDKKLKTLNVTDKNISKSKYEIINLDKENMIQLIFDTFTDISIEKAEKVFGILTIINNDMKKGKINDDKLIKAMEFLGLDVDNENPFLSKAKSDDDSEEDKKDEDSGIQKGDDEEDITEKAKEDETKKDDEEVEKAKDDTEEADDKKEADKVEKGQSTEILEKTGNASKGLFLLVQKEIQKAKSQNSEENKSLGILMKGVLEVNADITEKFAKSVEVIESQNVLIKGLIETIENFGAAPQDKKSITKGFAERFQENDTKTITKGNGAHVLSKSKDRLKILEVLDAKTFEKGFNEDFSKACVSFESSGNISPNIVQNLQSIGIVITE